MVDDLTSKMIYHMWNSVKNRSLMNLQCKIFINGLYQPGERGTLTPPGGGGGLGGNFVKILY